MDLKGRAYAQVKDRLSEFRRENPRGLIETLPVIQTDGSILFKARIVKDKSDSSSAEATGHALGPNKGDKAFEKLETIAVGRALALLGYATDGEIASSDEMEEFLAHRAEMKESLAQSWKEKVESVKDITELQKVWAEMPADIKPLLLKQKDEMKAVLMSESKTTV